ncbi:hypothetical protein [Streptomonospora alba]|uniref:hypothetical protein n=1 Tax=Streptomonospora alba TaxID=183763 RepID=UPI0012EE7D88|nr:hypothetical protein [Streptomonospora alba]
MAVLVQVAAALARSATVGAASTEPAGLGAGFLDGPLLWPLLAAGAVQAAAAAAIAACARVSWWPAVFSVLLLVGGVVQGRLESVEPLYLLLFGAVLVAPGLWVALWAWGWRWPVPGSALDRPEAQAPARAD